MNATSYDDSKPHVWNVLRGRCDQAWYQRQVERGLLSRRELRLIAAERGWVVR